MKILPVILFAAFCVTAHAQTTASMQQAVNNTHFMLRGQTYEIQFGDGNKAVKGHTIFQVIEKNVGTNWYLVKPSGNNISVFYINLDKAISVWPLPIVPVSAPPNQ